MNTNTFLKEHLSCGEFEHTGYHPVKDFLSGLLDITIIIPIIDCILGEDIITGERLNDFQRGMKLAGAAVYLFTLGQAMALTGGLEAGAKVIAKTIAVELLSNAASYTVGYGADAIGMPLPITWMLSVVTGCTVSATVGGYLFKSPDGTITKCSTEEAEEIIKNLDAGAEVELTGLKALPEERRKINSFADLMTPEDAERYLKFLENGSTTGLTKEELEGIKKVDELLALNKINYQDILDLRNSGNALKGSSKTIQNISDLSNEQIEALTKYTGDDYININNSLRGMETLTPENQATAEAIKSALDNSALSQDMTLYRGTSTETLGALQDLSVDELVGKTFTEQGFMSTSTNSAVAEGFSGNMQMTIEAAEGAQALNISSISQYATEEEVLFNAGQEMLITSAEVENSILHITVIIN